MRRIFWCFCINRFGIGPLRNRSSRNDFGFQFSEIFVIKKMTPCIGESTRLPGVTLLFKPLNKLIGIVHYTSGLFFCKICPIIRRPNQNVLLWSVNFWIKYKRSNLPNTTSRTNQTALFRPRIFEPKQKRSSYKKTFFLPNQNVLLSFL